MLKRILAAVVIFSLFVPVLCLGQKMPPEVKAYTLKFFQVMTSAQQTLSESVKAAKTPGQIAAAINVYNNAIESLIDGQVALEVKYSEYYASVNQTDDDGSSGDAEVDAAQKKFDSTQDSFESTAMAKIMQNYSKPEVNAAMTRMQEIMSRMDGGAGDEMEGDMDEGLD